MKSKTATLLHEATHRVPGVPAHDDTRIVSAGNAARPHAAQSHASKAHARLQNPPAHHQAPPRVLVGWQNWIASLGRKSR